VRIFLVGEAAEHRDDLVAHLAEPAEIIDLPRAAADSADHDHHLTADDVVVSLRFHRPQPAPRFGLLHVPGAGLDQIDLHALHPDTLVANVFEHEGPIGEFVLARLLEWEIRAEALQRNFGSENWSTAYRARGPHGELAGKTMGLIGYGRIGRAIAARAVAFGIRVVAVDDHAAAAGLDGVDLRPTAALPDVQTYADYLVVACPLTEATTGLVDAEALARMRRDAVLVNVSRGPIVDQWALYAALRDGSIGGAILDVWYRYPGSDDDVVAPADAPLWELPNAWCTPHCSAWTTELPRRRYALIADNVNRLAAGQPLRNVISRSLAPSSRRS
jgi:phosphoglycerate dehydrogenase-like enzyme